ncbi:MAG TPA: alpha/beta hydrolase family protein [Bryobacteraceae bacterium]|nr:alpha/beta hydrolase family protein [Bryobacteraceae bacterium]
MQDLTRRDITKVAIGAMAAAAAAPSPAQSQEPAKSGDYIGPLTGVSHGTEDRHFDPVAYSRMQYEAAPKRLAFQARTRSQAEAWQKSLHARLTELVGGFPAERTPLRPVILETRQFPTYRREKLLFDSRPGMSVLAYVLTPNDPLASPHPVMVCVPGHGRGVDDIVGIDEHGRDRTDKSGYQHDFAVQVAEAGIVAVAIEPMAFGCRRDAAAVQRGAGSSACGPSSGGALMLGQTMIGWRVYDVMRTIDYIETRPDLDARRVGCMGISGGGSCTLFAAALEPRIRVAMVSGFLNTFRDSIGSINHCIDNYVPGILNWAEMYDVAGLIAPRPLFSEAGQKDPIFPIKASVESYQRVKEIYTVFGAGDNVEQEVFNDVHSFWGKKGIPFVARHLTA